MHKSSPTPLDRDAYDVTDFKAAYQDYLGGGATFQTLSIDDAEWLLEAALNEANQIYELPYASPAVKFNDVTPYVVSTATAEGGGDVVESDDLFTAFGSALTAAGAFSEVLPMSDLELVYDPGDDNFFVHIAVARLDDRFRFGNSSSLVYDGSFSSVFAGTGGPIPTLYCDKAITSHEALEHNLALHFDPTAVSVIAQPSGGYYVNITLHQFGTNLNDIDTYIGRGPNYYDYAGYLWGDPNDGFSNGTVNQCIDEDNSTPDPSMTEYEDGIKNTLIPQEKTLSLKKAYGLSVDFNVRSSDNWYHHQLRFRTGAYLQ